MIDYDYEQIEIVYNSKDDRDFRVQVGGSPGTCFTEAEIAASRANAQERRLLHRVLDHLEADRRYAARCMDTDRGMALRRQQRFLSRAAKRSSRLPVSQREEFLQLDQSGRLTPPASARGGFDPGRLIRAAERRLGRTPGLLPSYLRRRQQQQQQQQQQQKKNATAAAHARDSKADEAARDDSDSSSYDDDNDDHALRTDRDFPPLAPSVRSSIGGGRNSAWSTHSRVNKTPARAAGVPFQGWQSQLWRGFQSAPAPGIEERRLTAANRRQLLAEEERGRMERLTGGHMRQFIESLGGLSLRGSGCDKAAS